MGTDCKLPFKVDQQAEAKSFLKGFRGAWFRCKISNIGWRRGQLSYALDFFDFPDEKTTWTKLFQKPPTDRANSQERKVELMVRPSFPPIYQESQIPDASALSGVVVIIANVWKVGDLVDWWTDGCYWSGRITRVLANDKVQVELPKPPVGEGKTYEAFCKDLRPSLNWSPEQGWTVPISTDKGTSCCARLIQPVNQNEGRKDAYATGEGPPSETIATVSSHSSACSLPAPDRSEQPPEQETTVQPSCGEVDEGGQSPSRKDAYATGEGPSSETIATVSSYSSACSLPEPDRSEQPPEQETTVQPSCGEVDEGGQSPRTGIELGLGDSSMGKANGTCSGSISSDKGASATVARTAGRKDRYGYGESPKKMRISGNECLNSMCSDTIESAILDLEELANRIKWLKEVLQLGFPLSNAMRPPWKFLENRASFTERGLLKK